MQRLSGPDEKMLGEKESGDFRDRHEDDEDGLMSFTPEEEQVMLKKLNWRVVGLIAFLYLLSFLDRSSKSCEGDFDIHSS